MNLDLESVFSGISSNPLTYTLFIISSSVIFAYIVHFFFKRYIFALANKTKTTLDDRIVKILDMPLFLAILSVGLYFTSLGFPELQPFGHVIIKCFVGFWILLTTFVVLKLGEGISEWYKEEMLPKNHPEYTERLPMLKRILQIAILVLGMILFLDNFGVEITPLLASLGIIGFASALAFQDTLANFFAGIYLTADKAIKTKDYIKLGSGEEGYVFKIGWRNTQLKTLLNNLIIIPNTKLAQNVITNFSAPSKEMNFKIPISVAYGADLEKVENIVIQEARNILTNIKGGSANYEPIIRYDNFGESGIEFSVMLRVHEFENQFLIRHEFIKAVHRKLVKENIELFLSPKRSVYIEKMQKIGKKGA